MAKETRDRLGKRLAAALGFEDLSEINHSAKLPKLNSDLLKRRQTVEVDTTVACMLPASLSLSSHRQALAAEEYVPSQVLSTCAVEGFKHQDVSCHSAREALDLLASPQLLWVIVMCCQAFPHCFCL